MNFSKKKIFSCFFHENTKFQKFPIWKVQIAKHHFVDNFIVLLMQKTAMFYLQNSKRNKTLNTAIQWFTEQHVELLQPRSLCRHIRRCIICHVSSYTNTVTLYKCFFLYVCAYVCIYIPYGLPDWLKNKCSKHLIGFSCRTSCPPPRLPPYIATSIPHLPLLITNERLRLQLWNFTQTILRHLWRYVCKKKNFDTFATFRVNGPLKFSHEFK